MVTYQSHSFKPVKTKIVHAEHTSSEPERQGESIHTLTSILFPFTCTTNTANTYNLCSIERLIFTGFRDTEVNQYMWQPGNTQLTPLEVVQGLEKYLSFCIIGWQLC